MKAHQTNPCETTNQIIFFFQSELKILPVVFLSTRPFFLEAIVDNKTRSVSILSSLLNTRSLQPRFVVGQTAIFIRNALESEWK